MRRTGECCRAALLWGAGAFLLLQLGLATAVELGLPELRDPEYGLRITRLAERTLRTGPPAVTVVMLGSSRTTAGFQAHLLESVLGRSTGRRAVAFNFGVTGAGPVLELLNLRRLLAAGVHPDLLLVEIAPPFFAGQVRPEAERLAVERLWLREVAFLGRYGRGSAEIGEWLRGWPWAWHTCRFAILHRTLPWLVPNDRRMDWAYRLDECGCVGVAGKRPGTRDRRTDLERARRDFGPFLDGFRLSADACRALDDLLDLCRVEHVRAVLVLMPEGGDFRSWYPAGAWDQVASYVARTAQGFGAPVVNARSWVPDEGFADSHHLLPEGGRRFTERLSREVVLPAFRG